MRSFSSVARRSAAFCAMSLFALGSTVQAAAPVPVKADEAPLVVASTGVKVLWPVNHELTNVDLTAVITDDLTANPLVRLFVFSNEDDESGSGDGNFAADATAASFSFTSASVLPTLRLRAERSGTGDGRVYVILVAALDADGHLSYDLVTVVVPKNKSKQALEAVLAKAAEAEAQAEDFFAEILGAGTLPAGYSYIGDTAPIGPKQ